MNLDQTLRQMALSPAVLALAKAKAEAAGEADLTRASHHFLDWLGCAIGGNNTLIGRNFLDLQGHDLLAGSPTERAQRLGGLGSLLEMDDVDRLGLLHPGPVVCAAALALATPETSGQLFLRALIAGYEAMIRLGRALGPEHYAFFHNSSTTGAFGAALCASMILELSEVETIWAAGHAMSMAGGLWECRNSPTVTKHLHVSEACRRGVQAALWAKAGLAGPATVLDGPQGFFAALAPQGRPESMLAAHPRALLHEVSFKLWPACRHAHAAIDATLLAAAGVEAQDVERVEAEVFADAVTFCDRPAPQTSGEAKFSLQHSIAIALRFGPPEMAHFEGAALSDRETAALRQKVHIRASAALSAAYPRHFGAKVTLYLKDGSRCQAQVEDAWGDSENPATPEDIAKKFDALCLYAGKGAQKTKGLRQAALALPSSDCGALLAAIATPE